MDSIDIDTLKRSCKANGLSVSNSDTKADLWARLKGTPGDKKKSKKSAVNDMVEAPPPSYTAKEFASLKAAGLEDEEEINAIILKRWNKIQQLKAAPNDDIATKTKDTSSNVVEEEVPLPVFLTPAQAAKSNLVLNNSEPNDKGMYIYTRISPESASLLADMKVEAAVPKVKAEFKPPSDPATEEAGAKPKRKWNFEEMDGFHDAAFEWAQKTIENRLMDKKRQKQNIANLCPDFNIAVVNDTKKRWMAHELARNFLQYTDDEDE